MKYLLIILSSFLFFSGFTGRVVKIADGDTITVLTENKEQIKVRLEGIDCPESSQDFGQKAKQATADICFGKNVTIKETGKDRYGRTLAFVYVNGVCLNKRLLELGMAWHYKKYNSDPELAKLEEIAKTKRVGLWADKTPIAPWDWRKANDHF